MTYIKSSESTLLPFYKWQRLVSESTSSRVVVRTQGADKGRYLWQSCTWCGTTESSQKRECSPEVLMPSWSSVLLASSQEEMGFKIQEMRWLINLYLCFYLLKVCFGITFIDTIFLIMMIPPYLWFCFPWFQLLEVSHGPEADDPPLPYCRVNSSRTLQYNACVTHPLHLLT